MQWKKKKKNRAAIYKKIATNERITAITAFLLISFAIVGPTLSELMIPLGLSTVDVKSANDISVL